MENFIGYDKWFVREVEKGLAQIKSGEVLEHHEVGARIGKVLRERKNRARVAGEIDAAN